MKLANQAWTEGIKPLVSVLCITYNHEKYIRQCLDGFLMQVTTFPVEIIIHDDASTDGTCEIIKQYCECFPQLFRTILQQENQYSQGLRPHVLAFPYAKGDLIATCEGDDYWTCPSKLQQQVEMFERYPGCILCGGRVAVIREGSPTPYRIEPFQEPELLAALGPLDMLKGDLSMRTASRMARREVWQGYINKVNNSALACDYLFTLYCVAVARATPDAFKCLDEVVGVYREHADGVWFGMPEDQKWSANIDILKFALTHFDFGRRVSVVEWVLLRNIRNRVHGMVGWRAYAVSHVCFFVKRNIRKIGNARCQCLGEGLMADGVVPDGKATPCVVFVCPTAYPLFDKRVQASIGGMETRSVLFAKALAGFGRWQTIFAVGDFGQKSPILAGDIKLVAYSSFAKRVRDNVVPRFQKHKWRPVIHLDIRDLHFLWQLPVYLLIGLLPKCLVNRFWRVMRPDVVCCFGNNPASAEVVADCYRDGIKTVLCIASDDDLSPDYRPGDRRLNDYGTPRWMAWYAVSTADYVMVQSERQRLLLAANFNRTGTLIHNPVSVPADARQHWPRREAREFVLWIGRSDTFHKRPLLVLDLARACPHIKFMMVANRTNQSVFETLQRDRPPNVTIIECVPHHQIGDYYRRARMLISTSAYEGFPNTFLQAAVAGVPVVSLNVDPEDILVEKGCGIFADGDFELFIKSVRSLYSNNALADRYAEVFFNYVFENHSLESQAIRLEALLEQVYAKHTSAPPACWHRPFSRFLPRPDIGN